MTPTPTTDSAVSPVSDERLKQLQFEVSAIEPSRRISMSSEDRRDLLSIFAELALSRRSLDTADGVEALAMRLCAKAEAAYGFMDMSSNEAKENWAEFCAAKAAIFALATAALASPPSPAEEAVTDDGFTAHDFASLEALLRTGTETGIKAALSNNFNVILAALDRAASPPVGTDAARDVLAERRRQVETEGWTPEHDDAHGNGELSAAAGVYALAAASHDYRWVLRGSPVNDYLAAVFKLWPFEWSWFKPKSRRQDKVKAAALLLADIEREDRAALTASLQLNKKG